MDLARELIYLAAGFYFLAKGSGWLVKGSSVIAGHMGVRQLVIGLTVVAWGTSAPEVVVSSLAAVDGRAGMSMGNVLGSNVANIGLVLGVSALILPRVLHGTLGLRESFWLLASVCLFWWTCSDYEVDHLDGLILLGCFAFYNLQLLWEARQGYVAAETRRKNGRVRGDTWSERYPVALTIVGGVLIAVAAWLTIEGAQGLARRAGMSDMVIGLTVLAIGTSLPELAAGVSGALKGHSDISIGNVVGSNVFNVLGVVGVVALIHPFGGPEEPMIQESLRRIVRVDFPIVIGFSLAALLIPVLGQERGGRLKGLVLLLSFVGWMLFKVATDLSA